MNELKLSNKTKAIACSIISSFGFASMTACVQLAGSMPSMQKIFFRNIGALAVSIIIILTTTRSFYVPKKARVSVLLRSFFGFCGMMINFWVLTKLNLADANMLNRMAPFFALVFSAVFLRESIKPLHVLCMAGAFVGCLLVIKPTPANINLLPGIIGVIGGMSAGAAATMLRKCAANGSPSNCTVFYFSLLSTLVILPFFILDFQPMTQKQILSCIGIGLFAGIGQFGLTRAYAYAPSREISIFEYMQVVFSAVLGFFLFGQLPDGFSFLGYMIIFGMAGLMFLFNNRMWLFADTKTE